ncbi:exported hypothetical protein [Nitrospira lenta]|uniref:Uncharacterized protein n=1 Tax=Nitrospira lenta TaxID=1436998 RepID=A0A330L4L9_9BACT|nr:exported hypothetical protein [Nitrospira lenta]
MKCAAASSLTIAIGPVRFAVAEQFIERAAGIFLIELLTIVSRARVPAIAAQSVVLAGYAQFIHRAVHGIQGFRRRTLAGTIALRVNCGKWQQENKYQKADIHREHSGFLLIDLRTIRITILFFRFRKHSPFESPADLPSQARC